VLAAWILVWAVSAYDFETHSCGAFVAFVTLPPPAWYRFWCELLRWPLLIIAIFVPMLILGTLVYFIFMWLRQRHLISDES
jgi:hypothetical protein